jgi:hypothetical protein
MNANNSIKIKLKQAFKKFIYQGISFNRSWFLEVFIIFYKKF